MTSRLFQPVEEVPGQLVSAASGDRSCSILDGQERPTSSNKSSAKPSDFMPRGAADLETEGRTSNAKSEARAAMIAREQNRALFRLATSCVGGRPELSASV
jgi:hypothetical protein